MNNQDPAVKEFIESNIELIDENNFSKLYITAAYNSRPTFVSNITEFLLSANIDPLVYMDFIPKLYLWHTSTEHFTIPSYIRKIENDAFGFTNLSHITIPSSVISIGVNAFCSCRQLKGVIIEEGVKRIEDYCFSTCFNIEKIYLPKSIQYLGRDIFQYNKPIIHIYYNGLEKDWILVMRDRDAFLKSKVIVHGLDFERQYSF